MNIKNTLQKKNVKTHFTDIRTLFDNAIRADKRDRRYENADIRKKSMKNAKGIIRKCNGDLNHLSFPDIVKLDTALARISTREHLNFASPKAHQLLEQVSKNMIQRKEFQNKTEEVKRKIQNIGGPEKLWINKEDVDTIKKFQDCMEEDSISKYNECKIIKNESGISAMKRKKDYTEIRNIEEPEMSGGFRINKDGRVILTSNENLKSRRAAPTIFKHNEDGEFHTHPRREVGTMQIEEQTGSDRKEVEERGLPAIVFASDYWRKEYLPYLMVKTGKDVKLIQLKVK